MFDAEGRVVVVNTAILSPTGGSVGIGFAISVSVVRPALETLAAGRRFRLGFMVLLVQDMTPALADALGLPAPRGALLNSVQPGGPVARECLRAGDVLLSVTGVEVAGSAGLPRVVAGSPPPRIAPPPGAFPGCLGELRICGQALAVLRSGRSHALLLFSAPQTASASIGEGFNPPRPDPGDHVMLGGEVCQDVALLDSRPPWREVVGGGRPAEADGLQRPQEMACACEGLEDDGARQARGSGPGPEGRVIKETES